MTRRLPLCCVLLAACGGSPPPPPETPEVAAAALAEALEAEEVEAAYARMSTAYRARVPFETFRARAAAGDLASTLAALRAPSEVEATLVLEDGRRVRLVRELEAWRLASEVLEPVDLSSPRAALRAFVGALEEGRFEDLRRTLAADPRQDVSIEGMREAWSGDGRPTALLTALRGALDGPVEAAGDRATIAYAPRSSIRFVREDGEWRIVAVE
jgi:hypothetical protein